MKPRLVLATPPLSIADRYGEFAGAANTQPSFGLVCLAAVARQAGTDVHIVEACAGNLSPETAATEILRHSPDIVGISATTAGIVQAGDLAQRLKRDNPRLVILLGGSHASALPQETLREFQAVDLIVAGEGELTLVDILEKMSGGTGMPSGIPGTVERSGNEILYNPPRPRLENLDDLPLPAWDLLPGFPRDFRPSPARIRRWPCASLVLTRGCPNRCTFCDRSVFGNQCRAYSPRRAIEILRDLHENYGVREFLLEDDTFTASSRRVREFCELLRESHLDLSWSCLGRADRADPDLFKLMRKAGCWHIGFGIESGDAEILKAVHKNLNLDQIRLALQWSREAGLRTKGFFIIGFPGETEKSLQATRELACALPLDDISVMQLTPFPGSEIYEQAGNLGEFNCDWKQMNTLRTVFIPSGFTRERLETARSQILWDFYLRPSLLVRHLVHILRHPRLLFPMLRGAVTLLRFLKGPVHE